MSATFSVLHATYGRPQKAIEAKKRWFERAARPEDVEYVFACNTEDDETFKAIFRHVAGCWTGHQKYDPHRIFGDFSGSAPAWNAAAKASTGRWLVQASDDVEPPQNWDQKLAWEMPPLSLGEFESPDVIARPTVIAVSDGYRKDALLTTAICNRARYEQIGHFICPEYVSLFSDDDFTVSAIRDSRAGKCTLIDARDLAFKHEHCVHNPAVPHDATYARGNNSDAYRIGSELFVKRNPDHRELRTWS